MLCSPHWLFSAFSSLYRADIVANPCAFAPNNKTAMGNDVSVRESLIRDPIDEVFFELLLSLSLAYCFRVVAGDVVESTSPCLFAGSEFPDDGWLDTDLAANAKLSTFVLPEC